MRVCVEHNKPHRQGNTCHSCNGAARRKLGEERKFREEQAKFEADMNDEMTIFLGKQQAKKNENAKQTKTHQIKEKFGRSQAIYLRTDQFQDKLPRQSRRNNVGKYRKGKK